MTGGLFCVLGAVLETVSAGLLSLDEPPPQPPSARPIARTNEASCFFTYFFLLYVKRTKVLSFMSDK
jgi:hypothetical protein